MANPSLSTKEQRKIVALIRCWQSKLTWDLLVDRIDLELDIETTRQTLPKYISIKGAYKDKKLQLRGASPEVVKEVTKSEVDLYSRVKRLEAEIEVLEKQKDEQLRYIERILANASEIPNIDLRALVASRLEES